MRSSPASNERSEMTTTNNDLMDIEFKENETYICLDGDCCCGYETKDRNSDVSGFERNLDILPNLVSLTDNWTKMDKFRDDHHRGSYHDIDYPYDRLPFRVIDGYVISLLIKFSSPIQNLHFSDILSILIFDQGSFPFLKDLRLEVMNVDDRDISYWIREFEMKFGSNSNSSSSNGFMIEEEDKLKKDHKKNHKKDQEIISFPSLLKLFIGFGRNGSSASKMGILNNVIQCCDYSLLKHLKIDGGVLRQGFYQED